METVFFAGNECHIYGELPVVGSKAPEFHLTGADLSDISLGGLEGRRVVLNIFPSLDTEVCARSVRRFNEEASKLEDSTVVCISMDLPFAMNRFCTIEGLKDVVSASAFRSPMFGKNYGVEFVDGPLKGLLARAVVVVDRAGKIAYRELVEEVTHEPDYDAALSVLRRL